MKDKEYYSLRKMLEYIDKIKNYTCGLSFENFSSNEMIVDATGFGISQIGELVKNISTEFQKEHSNIQWSVIKGLRNKIVHDYEGINLQMIWAIIQKDLPQLKEDLIDILHI